jgi:ABC-type transport system involved in Fe-S cluster assembly fused permease/ATPase subunit
MPLRNTGQVTSRIFPRTPLLTFPQVNDAIDKILRKRQTTCLLVAHRLSTIARAERIVVLEGSQLL